MKLSQRWNGFWFTPQSSFEPWGSCRFLFYLCVLYFFVHEPFGTWAELGRKSPFWDPHWMFKDLHLPLFSGSVLSVLGVVWKCALVAACLGLFTSVSTGISAVLGVYLLGLTFNYGKIEASPLPLTFVLVILAFSRCGDGFSLDALVRRRRGISTPLSGEYRWPVRMVWLLMGDWFFPGRIREDAAHTGVQWAQGARVFAPDDQALFRPPIRRRCDGACISPTASGCRASLPVARC